MELSTYIVVGGGLAGANATEVIRKHDPQGRIVLVTEEPHLPYDRVPLSKQYLTGQLRRERLFLKKPDFYEQQHIEVLSKRRVIKISIDERTLFLDNGDALGFSRLLLATGGRVRKLSIPGSELKGIYYLRTLDDSETLQTAISRSHRAVVIGGGFIGCEIAAAFHSRGLQTTIIEIGPSLLSMTLDKETAEWVTDYYRGRGVNVHTNVAAAKFLGKEDNVAGVETANGEQIPCDLVGVGVGIQPDVELAREAGLPVDNGILVDEHLESSSAGVFAAGDVARFYSPIYAKHIRVEHYDVAVKHGRIAGANMAGGSEVFVQPPYFFSFMFNLQVQVWGDLTDYDRVVRRGALQLTEKGGFAQFYLKNDRLQAYLGVNRLRESLTAQKLVSSRILIKNPDQLADENTELSTVAK